MARLRRDSSTGVVKTDLSIGELRGVRDIWHPRTIDCLKLIRLKQLTASTFEAECGDIHPISKSTATVIAKIARFEWKIPRIEQETRIYKTLKDTDIAPRFLGHIHEHGRVMGFALENLEGHEANINDLSACQYVLQRFHSLGLLHGDVNRYNFIIQDKTARLIDFERSNYSPNDTASMQNEMESLNDQLVEETGRGGGFRFSTDQI